MLKQDAWNRALHQLELRLGKSMFDTWLGKATLVDQQGGFFKVGVPSQTVRDMLDQRLKDRVEEALSEAYGKTAQVEFLTLRQAKYAHSPDEEMPLLKLLASRQNDEPVTNRISAWSAATSKPQLPELPESLLNPRMNFSRFVISPANRIAYEASQAVIETPASLYNPFLVYGGVGLGKSHILQAIGHAYQERGLKALYVPSEVFTNDLINAIRKRTTAMFREKYRSIDVLLVDDIQFIGGKESTQEEFFHTFNALVNFNKQVVLASDRHPSELKTLEDRLRSRFQGGLVVDVQQPTFEARMAILQMWRQEQGLPIEDSVLQVLAERAPSNIRDLEGVFNQIVAQIRFTNQNHISVYGAETTLERYQAPRNHTVTIHQIIEATAEHCGVSPSSIKGKGRKSELNQARQIAMYLGREMLSDSLTQIGKPFGRSHTTVLHGCNKIADEVEYDPVLSTKVKAIRQVVLNNG